LVLVLVPVPVLVLVLVHYPEVGLMVVLVFWRWSRYC
jgi:hypothetical protein